MHRCSSDGHVTGTFQDNPIFEVHSFSVNFRHLPVRPLAVAVGEVGFVLVVWFPACC